VNTETPLSLTLAAAVREGSPGPRFRRPSAVARSLRERVRATRCARLSVGRAGAALVSAPAPARRRAGAGVYGAWALVHGQARTLGVPQTGRVRHPGDVLRVLAAYTRRWAAGSRACASAVCPCGVLGWRRLAVWACGSPPRRSAGVVELVTLGARGVDRRALAALANGRDARAWVPRSRERGCSALPVSGVALSGVSESQPAASGSPLSGVLPARSALSSPSLCDRGADCLPSAWGAL
jgi:hypothetical protein